MLGREGGLIQQLYQPFFFGVGGRIGSGQQWFPWIHINDVTGIFTHVLENEQLSGVYNAVAPDSATNEEFTQTLASIMNRPAFLPVPSFMLNVIYGDARAMMMVEGQKILPKRTIASGYKFLFSDLNSALTNVLATKKSS